MKVKRKDDIGVPALGIEPEQWEMTVVKEDIVFEQDGENIVALAGSHLAVSLDTGKKHIIHPKDISLYVRAGK